MTAQDRERLAAEHVVGLLEGEERVEAERLLATDAAFQSAVVAWRRRLGELDETAPAMAVDEQLWTRIEAGLEQAPAAAPARTAVRDGVVVPSPLAVWDSLWASLRFWRTAGLAGALASLVLAVGIGVLATRDARKPVFVAVLLTDANQPAAVVNAYGSGRAELIPLTAIPVPPGRALEIWTLWDRARGPVSIGLVDEARTVRLNLENLPQTGPNQLFEITLEPATGSPTGKPTGPVLMKGTTSTAL